MSLVPDGALVVAVDGGQDGDGTLSSPLDLSSVLLGRRSRPGTNTVLLRGGIYRGAFVSKLRGTATDPITVRSFPGEWAVIDAGERRGAALSVQAPYSTFRDLEIMHSPISRRALPGAGVEVLADRTQLINLVVHDNSNGIRLTDDAPNAEVHGSIVFNNGDLVRRGTGRGIDIENADGTKLIENTFVFNNFEEGINVRGLFHDASKVVLRNVVSFENGAPSDEREPNVVVGTSNEPADHVSLDHGVFYHRTDEAGNVELGSKSVRNAAVKITGNDFIGGRHLLSVENWRAIDVRNNRFALAAPTDREHAAIDLWTPGWLLRNSSIPDGYRWEDNVYAGLTVDAERFGIDRSARSPALTFEAWKDRTGFDDASIVSDRASEEATVRIHPNRSAAGRANIVVENPSEKATVAVDLAPTGIGSGTRFEIRDVQGLSHDPVVSGVYDGSPIEIPMRIDRVMQPIGRSAGVTHTPPAFGAFVLVPVG